MNISAPQADLQALTWVSGAQLPTAINGGTITLVKATGGSNSLVQWWDDSAIQRTTEVDETPAAVAALFTNLFTVTAVDTAIGAIYLNAIGVLDLLTNGSGCRIIYSNGGLPAKNWDVTDSVATVKALINASTPSGNFVTTDTNQTIVAGGTKTWQGQQTYEEPSIYSNAPAVAAAGVVAGTATQLTEENSVVATGTQLQGVKLPIPAVGTNFRVMNRVAGNVTILVYPYSTRTIEGLAADIPVSLPAGWAAEFQSYSNAYRVNFVKYADPTALGLTAFATGGQGSATVLAGITNTVTVVGTAADSAKVMPLANYPNAVEVYIGNTAALAMDLFPAVGENIGAGVNAAISVPGGTAIILKKISETAWLAYDGTGGEVTLATAQTITGAKIFTAQTEFTGGVKTGSIDALSTAATSINFGTLTGAASGAAGGTFNFVAAQGDDNSSGVGAGGNGGNFQTTMGNGGDGTPGLNGGNGGNGTFRAGDGGGSDSALGGNGGTLTLQAGNTVAGGGGSGTPGSILFLSANGTTQATINNSGLTVAGRLISQAGRRIALTAVGFAQSPYTVLLTDDYIEVDSTGGAVTLVIPDASTAGAGALFIIKDIANTAAANNITLDPAGADTIDLAPTFVMNSVGQSVMLISGGGTNYGAN